MTGVYESGPADSVTDITQTDGGADGIEEGEGKERELEGEGLFDSCSSNFYFSRSAVQLRHTHTHTLGFHVLWVFPYT